MWSKVLIALISAVVFAVIASCSQYFIWQITFKDVMNDEAFDGIWRAMNDPAWTYGLPFANFIYGISFYIAYTLLKNAMLWCYKPYLRGSLLGLVIWLFIGLTGSILWFIAHPVNELLMLASMLDQLLTLAIGGGAVAFIVEKHIERKNRLIII
jgi:hypothetical protein